MANGDIFPGSFWRLPSIGVPSWVEDIEEMLPTTSLIRGLSVSEDDKNVYVEAAVPGIDAKDVEVTFDKGFLTIRAEKKEEEKRKKYERRATSSFLYQIRRNDVDPKAKIKAVCKNGQMNVALPKIPELAPKKIPVLEG